MILGVDFSEIILIGLLALVVLGPDKLIKVASITGKLVGKLQSSLANIKFALNSNQELADLKNKLNELKHISSINGINKEHSQATTKYNNLIIKHSNIENEKGFSQQQATSIQSTTLPSQHSNPNSCINNGTHKSFTSKEIQNNIPRDVINNASVKYHQPELNLGEQPELFD